MKSKGIFKMLQNQFLLHPLKRMNFINIQKELKNMEHDLSNFQLLALYREINRVSNKPQTYNFNSQGAEKAQINQQQDQNIYSKSVQHSFQKRLFISIQQMVFKNRQKNQHQIGKVDLATLYYYRLLNAIKFQLPFQHIIEPFKQYFYVQDFGTQIINYLPILYVSPISHKEQIQQIANFILSVLKQQLLNINAKQYVYVKFALEWSYYPVDLNLSNLLNQLIDENLKMYNYVDLLKLMSLPSKTIKTIRRFAFYQKNQIRQKVAYLFLNLYDKKHATNLQLRNANSLVPGAILTQQTLIDAIKYQNKYFFNLGDIQIFQDMISKQDHTLPNLQVLRTYVNYQFTIISWLFKSPQTQKFITIKTLRRFLVIVSNTIKKFLFSIEEKDISTALQKQKINTIKLKTILWLYEEVKIKLNKEQVFSEKIQQQQPINLKQSKYITIIKLLQKNNIQQYLKENRIQLQKLTEQCLEDERQSEKQQFEYLNRCILIDDKQNPEIQYLLGKIPKTKLQITLSILISKIISAKFSKINNKQDEQKMLNLIKKLIQKRKNDRRLSIINNVVLLFDALSKMQAKQKLSQ